MPLKELWEKFYSIQSMLSNHLLRKVLKSYWFWIGSIISSGLNSLGLGPNWISGEDLRRHLIGRRSHIGHTTYGIWPNGSMARSTENTQSPYWIASWLRTLGIRRMEQRAPSQRIALHMAFDFCVCWALFPIRWSLVSLTICTSRI